MKRIIVFCTIALCGVIIATGYFVACACGNGAMSTPTSYLDTRESLVLALFIITALINLIFAIKESRN